MFTATKTRIAPTQIAPDTYLIHNHEGEGQADLLVAMNTMVIRAREPVVVDTGLHEYEDQYLDDLFSLVEPDDIRWVFISHDDHDHTGNVRALMDRAPNATVVVNWFMVERMGQELSTLLPRMRWVGDGESFDVGDRRLQAVRPPVFDAPTTRGLFDPTTGVYWAADSFATPMLAPAVDVDEIDVDLWSDGRSTFDNYVSPWLELVDDARFQRTVDRIEALAPKTIAGCHTPLIRSHRVADAIASVRRSPGATVMPQPDQSVLEDIQRALTPVA